MAVQVRQDRRAPRGPVPRVHKVQPEGSDRQVQPGQWVLAARDRQEGLVPRVRLELALPARREVKVKPVLRDWVRRERQVQLGPQVEQVQPVAWQRGSI